MTAGQLFSVNSTRNRCGSWADAAECQSQTQINESLMRSGAAAASPSLRGNGFAGGACDRAASAHVRRLLHRAAAAVCLFFLFFFYNSKWLQVSNCVRLAPRLKGMTLYKNWTEGFKTLLRHQSLNSPCQLMMCLRQSFIGRCSYS